MENWDFMEENLKTAGSASGELQKQADIYAESWDAASKRVKASAETIYGNLLKDDFFIDMFDGFADFLGLLDKAIDSMGGMKGLLTGLSSILLNTFAG
jgi:hypothetical protein